MEKTIEEQLRDIRIEENNTTKVNQEKTIEEQLNDLKINGKLLPLKKLIKKAKQEDVANITNKCLAGELYKKSQVACFEKTRIRYLRQAVEIYQEFATAHVELGDIYFDNYEYDRAISEYESARKLQNPPIQLLLNLGISYAGINKYAEAIPVLKEAVKLDPLDIEIRIMLGHSLRKVGNLEEALDQLQKAEDMSTMLSSDRRRVKKEIKLIKNKIKNQN